MRPKLINSLSTLISKLYNQNLSLRQFKQDFSLIWLFNNREHLSKNDVFYIYEILQNFPLEIKTM